MRKEASSVTAAKGVANGVGNIVGGVGDAIGAVGDLFKSDEADQDKKTKVQGLNLES